MADVRDVGRDDRGRSRRSNGSVRVDAEAAGSYPFTTRARRDEYGLDGPIEPRRLIVRPDRPPTLSLQPPDAREANPDDVLTVPLEARDDFAVDSAELHFTVTRANSEGIEPASGKRNLALDGLGTGGPGARRRSGSGRSSSIRAISSPIKSGSPTIGPRRRGRT